MPARPHVRSNGCAPLRRIDCVGILIRKFEESQPHVLLVWNADWRTPSWSLPGGAREMGEALRDAAVREVLEETGLEVDIGELIDVHEIVGVGGKIHLMIFTFDARVIGGSLITDGHGEPDSGGVSEARWFPLSEAMRFPAVSRILEDLGDGRSVRCTADHRVKVKGVVSRPNSFSEGRA